MDAIVSLTSQANVLGRQYGFGDLSIKTFTGLLQLKNLPQISAAQKLLEFLIEQNHLYQQREEEHDFENLLRSRAGLKVEQPAEENAEQSSSDHGDTSNERAGGFFSNRLRMRQSDGKVVVYRTHWLFLFRKTFLPFLVFVILILLLALMHAKAPMMLSSIIVKSIMVVLILLVLGWWLYQFMDWRNDQYIITPDQLIDVYRRPLGLEDKRTAPLESIQSIRYKRRGVLGLVFNFGTVFVKVGNEDFTFDNIHNPLEVQQTLFGYLEKANLLEKQANLVDQRRQMADWMDTYQRFSKEHPDSSDEQDK
jgi:membrane protein YdbS with pleckstrin-like domain